MSRFMLFPAALMAFALGAVLQMAHAQDALKIAAGQRGNWDTTIAEVGQRAGIFKKHGLTLEILWTQGAAGDNGLQRLARALQAIISGSADIGRARRSPTRPTARRRTAS